MTGNDSNYQSRPGEIPNELATYLDAMDFAELLEGSSLGCPEARAARALGLSDSIKSGPHVTGQPEGKAAAEPGLPALNRAIGQMFETNGKSEQAELWYRAAELGESISLEESAKNLHKQTSEISSEIDGSASFVHRFLGKSSHPRVFAAAAAAVAAIVFIPSMSVYRSADTDSLPQPLAAAQGPSVSPSAGGQGLSAAPSAGGQGSPAAPSTAGQGSPAAPPAAAQDPPEPATTCSSSPPSPPANPSSTPPSDKTCSATTLSTSPSPSPAATGSTTPSPTPSQP